MPNEKIAGYEHLFEMGDRIEKMQHREIEEIVQEITNRSCDHHRGRKWTNVDARNKNQDEQSETVGKKSKTMQQRTSLVLESFSVILQMMAAAGGGQATPFGAGTMAFSQAFGHTAQFKGKKSDATVDGYNHQYQCLSSLIQERSQQMQGADRECDQLFAMIDRIKQNAQQMFQLLLSSSS